MSDQVDTLYQDILSSLEQAIANDDDETFVGLINMFEIDLIDQEKVMKLFRHIFDRCMVYNRVGLILVTIHSWLEVFRDLDPANPQEVWDNLVYFELEFLSSILEESSMDAEINFFMECIHEFQDRLKDLMRDQLSTPDMSDYTQGDLSRMRSILINNHTRQYSDYYPVLITYNIRIGTIFTLIRVIENRHPMSFTQCSTYLEKCQQLISQNQLLNLDFYNYLKLVFDQVSHEYADIPPWVIQSPFSNQEDVDETATKLRQTIFDEIATNTDLLKIFETLIAQAGIAYSDDTEGDLNSLSKIIEFIVEQASEGLVNVDLFPICFQLRQMIDEELFRFYGPSNRLGLTEMDTHRGEIPADPCQRWGGCRMLLCNHLENYDPDTGEEKNLDADTTGNYESVRWFGRCNYCHRKIKSKSHAFRVPNRFGVGGFISCFCSIEHARLSVDKNDIKSLSLIDLVAERLLRIGIYDRDWEETGSIGMFTSIKEQKTDRIINAVTLLNNFLTREEILNQFPDASLWPEICTRGQSWNV